MGEISIYRFDIDVLHRIVRFFCPLKQACGHNQCSLMMLKLIMTSSSIILNSLHSDFRGCLFFDAIAFVKVAVKFNYCTDNNDNLATILLRQRC